MKLTDGKIESCSIFVRTFVTRLQIFFLRLRVKMSFVFLIFEFTYTFSFSQDYFRNMYLRRFYLRFGLCRGCWLCYWTNYFMLGGSTISHICKNYFMRNTNVETNPWMSCDSMKHRWTAYSCHLWAFKTPPRNKIYLRQWKGFKRGNHEYETGLKMKSAFNYYFYRSKSDCHHHLTFAGWVRPIFYDLTSCLLP
jgi:hypothetical protein